MPDAEPTNVPSPFAQAYRQLLRALAEAEQKPTDSEKLQRLLEGLKDAARTLEALS